MDEGRIWAVLRRGVVNLILLLQSVACLARNRRALTDPEVQNAVQKQIPRAARQIVVGGLTLKKCKRTEDLGKRCNLPGYDRSGYNPGRREYGWLFEAFQASKHSII